MTHIHACVVELSPHCSRQWLGARQAHNDLLTADMLQTPSTKQSKRRFLYEFDNVAGKYGLDMPGLIKITEKYSNAIVALNLDHNRFFFTEI